MSMREGRLGFKPSNDQQVHRGIKPPHSLPSLLLTSYQSLDLYYQCACP